MVYVVRCGDETRCAKVYKEATQRSFRQAVDYTENRKVKNTPAGARHGQGHALRPRRRRKRPGRAPRSMRSTAWRPPACACRSRYNFHDGVLLMELVADARRRRRAAPQRRRLHGRRGARAPRHADRRGGAHAVRRRHPRRPVGVQHPARRRRPGDHRPAAGGRRGRQQPRAAHAAARRRQPARLLRPLRAGAAGHRSYGAEIWALYTRGVLQPATPLTGRFDDRQGPVDVAGVLRVVADARDEEAARLLRMRVAAGGS